MYDFLQTHLCRGTSQIDLVDLIAREGMLHLVQDQWGWIMYPTNCPILKARMSRSVREGGLEGKKKDVEQEIADELASVKAYKQFGSK